MKPLSIAVTGVNVAVGATSTDESIPNAASGKARYMRLAATTNCYVRWGQGAQTAVSTDMLLVSGESVVVAVNAADTIAAIRVSADGVLVATPLENQ